MWPTGSCFEWNQGKSNCLFTIQLLDDSISCITSSEGIWSIWRVVILSVPCPHCPHCHTPHNPPVTALPPSFVLGVWSCYIESKLDYMSITRHMSIICWLYYVYIPNETLHYFLLISWPVSLPVNNKLKIKALLDWYRTKQYTIYIMTLWLYITSIMLIQYTTLYYIHYVCTIHYITVHTVQVNSLHVCFGSRCIHRQYNTILY